MRGYQSVFPRWRLLLHYYLIGFPVLDAPDFIVGYVVIDADNSAWVVSVGLDATETIIFNLVKLDSDGAGAVSSGTARYKLWLDARPDKALCYLVKS